MKLTQSTLAKLELPDGSTDKIFFDDALPGFGVRIREGGSRKFVVHYRIGSTQRRHTIGPVAVLTLEAAREKARKVMVTVSDGRDPAADRASQRATASLLFSDVVDDYLTARARDLKPNSLTEARRYLKEHCRLLHRLAIGNVTRATIAATLRDISRDHGPISANRARSAISTFYAWTIGEGLCETNPVIGTNKAADETPRDRVLTDAELAAVWIAAPASPFGRIVRLLTLTGQRRNEIGGLQWSEIKSPETQGKALIALPGERTKNGRPHEVPLSTAALKSLKGQPRIAGRAFVFGEGGYAAWARSKDLLDAACGVSDWTLHDLRRTAATRMADLGVQPHVIEAILNHVSGHKAGVAGIYNRSTYAVEKRAALDLWANHLRVIVAQASGTNVQPLRRTKAD